MNVFSPDPEELFSGYIEASVFLDVDEVANLTFDAIATFQRLVITLAGHSSVIPVSGQHF